MKQMRILTILGILFLGSITVFSQTLKEKAESGDMVAQYQYANSLTNWHPKEDDYKQAVVWLRKSAEQGYAPAQCSLGYHYWAGKGINQNFEQAVLWYRKAAEQGNETAQFNLGVCYANGQGVTRSDYNAFTWYKKAAEQGYKNAEYSLGKAYYYGKGTTENNRLAFEWFSKAAAQKHSGAMYFLGECYSRGYGVAKDMAKAVEWFEKGADDSDTSSQYALALLYLKGDGVEKDSIFAANLLLHSAGGGWCSPHQLFTYDKENANSNAKKKLLELSSLNNSPIRYYFLAITGCLYDAMQDYKTAESYYKQSIDLGGYLGTIELGLMYFYIAANTPQLYSNYDNFEGSEEEGLGLESYMCADNTACLEYVKTKVWTDTDNVTYWLEKAIGYGFGSFAYGSMPYTLYDHLLFAYVDEIGAKRNLDRAVDIATLCLADTTIQYGGYTALGALEIASNKVELQPKVFQTYLSSYEFLHNHLNDDNKWNYTNMAAGLGKCYYKGLGTTKNYNQAFKYLLEAANNGDCESMRLLAACYRYGRGTTANRTKENEWVEKAAKCGDDKAKKIKERRGR